MAIPESAVTKDKLAQDRKIDIFDAEDLLRATAQTIFQHASKRNAQVLA